VPHLLVVEDDEDMRFAFTLMLEREGYQVSAVPSGEMALEMIREQEFDLLLVDLLLPGMDGAELCRTVRAEKTHCGKPIVMITCMMARMGIDITEADAHWAPVDRVVDKAAPVETLLATIRQLLNRKKD